MFLSPCAFASAADRLTARFMAIARRIERRKVKKADDEHMHVSLHSATMMRLIVADGESHRANAG